MSIDPYDKLPYGDQVFWPQPVPDNKAVCTTTDFTISRYCCDMLRGISTSEKRASPLKEDTVQVEQANCLSDASLDDWRKCAFENLNGTSRHNFFAYCSNNARTFKNKYASTGSSGISLGKLGTLSVVTAAALSVLSAI